MSHYCLFIDESGDFGHPGGKAQPSREWIISGILCPAKRDDVEKMILEALIPVGTRYGMPTDQASTLNIQAWHLTELRIPKNTSWPSEAEKSKEIEECNQRANQIAFDLFAAMLALAIPMRFLVVINDSRADVGDPEKTYRMMVMDLLALAEAALPEEERIASLDVYVAVRSKMVEKNGKKTRVLMTPQSEMDKVLDTLGPSAEVGLAARGLVDLVSHKLPGGGQKFKLELTEYVNSWGLPVADFLANTVYNRTRDGSAASLNMLDLAGRFSRFTSLGAYEERRSHIAARDGDYGAALYWWAVAETRSLDYQAHFIDLVQTTMAVGGASTARAALETLIERFWQQAVHGSAHTRIFKHLERAEAAYTSFVGRPPDKRTLPLLFRLRNFMIAMANHIGDAGAGQRLYRLQEADRSRLSFIPENLFLLLDLDLYATELAVNDLSFDQAGPRSMRYLETVESYREIWRKINPDATDDFDTSRLYHRAFSTQVRTTILAATPLLGDRAAGSDLDRAVSSLQGFEALPLHPADQRRAANYRIMALLKLGRAEEALRTGLRQPLDGQDAFDILWTARAVADALDDGLEVHPEAAAVLKRLRSLTGDGPRTAHPYELLWRERGYLEWLIHRDENAAERCFRRSEDLLRPVKDFSPINTWLWHLLQLHRSNRGAIAGHDFTGNIPLSGGQGARQLAQKAIQLNKKRPDLTLLRCARLVSPY